MRTGWIRASEGMIQRFAAARTTMDLGGPVVEQLAAAHLVRNLTEPLPGRLAALRENRLGAAGTVAGHLPKWQAERPDGGLSVWCRLPAPISTALTVIAPDFGIRLAAGPRFGVGGVFEHYLRVPFTLPPDQLETAVTGAALGPGQAGGRPAAAPDAPELPRRRHRLTPTPGDTPTWRRAKCPATPEFPLCQPVVRQIVFATGRRVGHDEIARHFAHRGRGRASQSRRVLLLS